MKLIVGLGNPGKKYEFTRHNIGTRIVREIAKKNRFKFKRNFRSKSLVASGKIDTEDVKLACPLVFMNVIGEALMRLIKAEKIKLENLLVICDDINLQLGKIRIRHSGSDGGHNGLKSIIEMLGTKEVPRLRIGIGRTTHKEELSNFVLSNFTRKEELELTHSIKEVEDCCNTWLKNGIVVAMSKFN